jgi:hypothetical protein
MLKRSLVNKSPYGHNYILSIVDHLSKFRYVQPLKRRCSEEVGDALISILSMSIMPRILQSDNGGKVCMHFCCMLLTDNVEK